ncbi:MAG: T9SS type A sorting domain-containing protein [Bacteroidota bacterium]
MTALALREARDVWVGTQDGLFLFEQGAWRRIDLIAAGLPGEHVTMLLPELNGALWVAARDEENQQSGLARYTPAPASTSSSEEPEAVDYDATLDAYPNPTSQGVQIGFTATHGSQYTLQIHDVTGRRLGQYQRRLAPGQPWNVTWQPDSNLSAGIYVLVLSDEQRVVARRSVSVLR